jgi:subtilase family serine protease
LKVYDEVFEQGNAQGITFVASSGDEAGLECPSVNYFYGASNAKFVVSVSTPADDPNVTSVGGGNLFTTPPPANQPSPTTTFTSKYVSENALGDPEIPYDVYGFGENVSGGYWGAGGGRSAIFAMPTYQNWVTFYGNSAQGRIMPDVGMQVGGCPYGISEPNCPVAESSYVITVINGGHYGLIGTSVASPEFVGALALAVEAAGGRVGNINPFLWSQGYVQTDLGGARAALPARFYHKAQPGFDGHFHHASTVGFDYMYGNGSPDVRRLFGLTNFAPAGDPQTPSNP